MTPMEQVLQGIINGMSVDNYIFSAVGIMTGFLLKQLLDWLVKPTVKYAAKKAVVVAKFCYSKLPSFSSTKAQVDVALGKLRAKYGKHKHNLDFTDDAVILYTGNQKLREPMKRGKEHQIALRLIKSADNLNGLLTA